jgi:mersacidin/lichenicidin family type 2 lantibiotic
MPKVDIIRAWKDEEYRLGLSSEERALLPEHPAGLIELDDEQMKAVVGAHGQQPTTTATTKLIYCG